MKKIMLLAAAALTALSLAACTPTPEKEAETAESIQQTTAVALKEGKVPGPEEAMISVYGLNNAQTGLRQNMDSLEELTEQGLVDKLIEYGMLDEGTTIISMEFNEDDSSAVVNLSALPDFTGDTFREKTVLMAVVNTFLENYELELVKVQVNGVDANNGAVEADENGYSTYFDDYKEVQ